MGLGPSNLRNEESPQLLGFLASDKNSGWRNSLMPDKTRPSIGGGRDVGWDGNSLVTIIFDLQYGPTLSPALQPTT